MEAKPATPQQQQQQQQLGGNGEQVAATKILDTPVHWTE
jgi:hypothetical protein